MRRYDVVVIGAGSLGASSAYHLAARGLSVAVLDRSGPASQTSPNAAGLAVQIYSDEHLSRISMRSAAKLKRFEEETGEPLTVHVTGSIKLARTDRDADQVAREIDRGRRLGIEVAPLDPRAAIDLAPWLDPGEATAMWFAPDDLYLEPGDLPRAYMRAAERLGVELIVGAAVTELITGGDGETLVRTSEGEIGAGAVVVAAGAWTPGLLAPLGLRLPIAPTRHMLLVTEPLDLVSPQHPCVRVIDAHAYIRPEQGGLMFGAYEPEPLVVDDDAVPPAIAQLTIDPAPLREVMATVTRSIPALADARIRLVRGGLPMMSTDGGWIITQLPLAGRVFVATADNVAGLGPSPAIGEDLATWIDTGERPAALVPFGLERFGPLEPAEIRAGVTEAYAGRYRS